MNQPATSTPRRVDKLPGSLRVLDPDRLAAEQDFRLFQRLFLAPDRQRAVIAFCPVEAGNGCSWVVSRAARTLARNLSHSVCVVDADFRLPAQHRNFGLSSPKGFAQSILETVPARSLAQQIAGSNLWVLPAGGVFADPYRLLLADSARARLEELRQEFDYVLVDTPPARAYADATLISKWADGVVMVLEADVTTHENAIRVREELESLNIPVIGAVLNRRTFPIPEFLFRRI